MCTRWVLLVFIINIHLKIISPQFYGNQYYPNMQQYYAPQNVPQESAMGPYIQTRRSGAITGYVDSDGIADTSEDFTIGVNTNPNPNNLVFVPYPFPLVIPNMIRNSTANSSEASETDTTALPRTTTTKQTTTTATTTKATTTEVPTTTKTPTSSHNVLQTNILEDSMISGRRNIKLLNPASKRTRPSWVPKYGIVPIPDNLAAKLMSQLTEVRALKARRH